jgi:hypothetical protein
MPLAEEKRVYVRRTHGSFLADEWVEGKDHHKAAFDIFLSDTKKSSIKVPRQDGGNFFATFYGVKVGENIDDEEFDYEKDNGVFFLFPILLGEDVHEYVELGEDHEYADQYGFSFQIMYNTHLKSK